MQENEGEQPSSFHKSEASNRFFCGKDQMSITAGFSVTGGDVSKGELSNNSSKFFRSANNRWIYVSIY